MNPFRLLFSFRGRTGRAAFLFGVVVAKVLAAAALWGSVEGLPAMARMLSPLGINAAKVQTGLWLAIGLLFLWMILALTFKRLHDRGHFGFWALIAFVPMAAMLVLDSNLLTIKPLVTIPEPAQFAIWGVSLLVAAWVVIECLLLPGSRLDDDGHDEEEASRHRLARLANDR